MRHNIISAYAKHSIDASDTVSAWSRNGMS